MRERGNIWPLASVIGGAFFMLVIVPLVLHRQQTGQMATVDAQVTIGDGGTDPSDRASVPKYRWPDSEVPRTAERLRDATAIGIAAATTVVEYALHNQVMVSAEAIVKDNARRGLIPADWVTNEPGVLVMPHATVQVRYSPRNCAVEVLSAQKERNDGPAILIRIPDAENVSVGSRYFESLQLDGINYPPPFTPVSQIIASGWQTRSFKQDQLPDDQRAQLEQWAKSAVSKQPQ